MKYAAAAALASMVKLPSPTEILPDPFYPQLAERIADAIIAAQ